MFDRLTKNPKNHTLVILFILIIIVCSLLFIMGRPKQFVFDASPSGNKVMCGCIGRITPRDELRENCRGIVLSCNKVKSQ